MSKEVVTAGNDGWLFLTGGTNRVLEIYSGLNINPGWEKKWAQVIAQRANFFHSKNILYYHVSAPEKIGVYGQHMSGHQKIDVKNSPSSVLGVEMQYQNRDCYINPIHYLKQQSENYKVYHKTDSHWTFTGAYCTYQLIMSKLGLSANEEIISRNKNMVSCVMDLAGKLEDPISEVVSFHRLASGTSRTEINSLVEFKESNKLDNNAGLHVGCSVTFKNEKPMHNKRILIFGDSFSEYRPHLLTGILAETFREVKFVWGLNIDYSVVEDFSPDIVLTEAAERFMPFTTPTDDCCNEEVCMRKINEFEVDKF